MESILYTSAGGKLLNKDPAFLVLPPCSHSPVFVMESLSSAVASPVTCSVESKNKYLLSASSISV